MQQLNTYKKEGKLALRHMWIVVLIFTACDVVASVAVADLNVKKASGFEGAAFAAVWSAFLQLFFSYVGTKVIYGAQPSPALMVGFLLGLAVMLAQLFFMLTCWYLALGVQAAQNGWATAAADKAMGAFCFINMIIYAVFAIILAVHRSTVTMQSRPINAMYGKNSSSDYDPTINEDYGEDEQV